MDFILGLVIGAVFSPLLIKLFKIVWAKLEAKIENYKNK